MGVAIGKPLERVEGRLPILLPLIGPGQAKVSFRMALVISQNLVISLDGFIKIIFLNQFSRLDQMTAKLLFAFTFLLEFANIFLG